MEPSNLPPGWSQRECDWYYGWDEEDKGDWVFDDDIEYSNAGYDSWKDRQHDLDLDAMEREGKEIK